MRNTGPDAVECPECGKRFETTEDGTLAMDQLVDHLSNRGAFDWLVRGRPIAGLEDPDPKQEGN